MIDSATNVTMLIIGAGMATLVPHQSHDRGHRHGGINFLIPMELVEYVSELPLRLKG